MKTFLLVSAFTLTGLAAFAQNDTIPKKGSYLEHGQPLIEDNSMLIEEAFNQEAGVIQHISNLIIDEGNIIYAYTQEIPLADVKHQLSFGITYNSFKMPDELKQHFTNAKYVTHGIGDLLVNYRPMLFGKNDWALVIPRFTLIAPLGDARYGFGAGAWGGQFNLAVTKRLGKKFVTHYNAGYTAFAKADFYGVDAEGSPKLLHERNLTGTNLGVSAIWFATPRFNLVTEYACYFNQEFGDLGEVGTNRSVIINPGFRFAVDIGKVQIVPGAGIPLNFANGTFQNSAAFIYLSIEPAY